MTEKTNVFVVDCRMDGVAGPFIWIAAVVTDRNTHVDKVHFNGVVDFTKFEARDEYTRSKTVPYANKCLTLDNVDMRRPTVYHCPVDLMNAFWAFYLTHYDSSYVVADYTLLGPERMFASCIDLDAANRQSYRPHPLIDLSTVLTQNGYYGNMDREEYMAEHKCSVIPQEWTEKSIDPMYGVMRTLSICDSEGV